MPRIPSKSKTITPDQIIAAPIGNGPPTSEIIVEAPKPGQMRDHQRQAVQMIVDSGRVVTRLLDACYGPQAAAMRAQIASFVLDSRKVSKSSKEAQWGNFRNMMLALLGIAQAEAGLTIAGSDAEFERIARQLLTETAIVHEVAEPACDESAADLVEEPIPEAIPVACIAPPVEECLTVDEMAAPTRPITAEFLSLGYAVALADLADAKGMDVAGVASLPHLLKDAGLPACIGPSVVRRAHKINRDSIDAMLWRGNRDKAEVEVVAKPKQVKAFRPVASGEVGPEGLDTGLYPVGVAIKATPKIGAKAILGFSASRVVIWMGRKGLSVQQAAKVTNHYGVPYASSSLQILVSDGKSGKNRKGQPAELSETQAAELLAIANS